MTLCQDKCPENRPSAIGIVKVILEHMCVKKRG